MKIKIFSVLLLLASIVSMMSCMKEDTKIMSYDDAAIASFSLGTLSRTYNTKTKAGKDTTVTVTFSGKLYPFYLDQKNGSIWNPDSLPYGTKINAVICNISTVNAGTVTLLNLTRDSITFWQNTDSVDLSYDRGIRIFSNSRKYSRDYNVHVNICTVPKQRAEWTAMPKSDIIGLFTSGVRVFSVNGKLIVYGSDGNATYAYCTTNGEVWENLGTIGDADAWKGIVGAGGNIYTIAADGKLMRSTDGATFETVADASAYGVTKLIGGSQSQMFSLSTEGDIQVSTDNGITWKADTLIKAKDMVYMPNENLNLVSMQHKVNSDMTVDLLLGTSTSVAEKALVWRKIENEAIQYAGWDCITVGNETKKEILPKLHNLCVVNTTNYLIAIGGEADENGVVMHNEIWVSMDQGLTWFTTTALQMPDDFDTSATSWSATADTEGYVWIVLGKTGQVWKVKVNGL